MGLIAQPSAYLAGAVVVPPAVLAGFPVSANVTIDQLIAALYPSGSDGAIYNIADLAGYQESTGLTTAAVGSAEGLLLDQRYGMALGPELITNGSFADATGWTAEAGWAIGSGVATFTNADSTSTTTNLYQIALTANKTYRIQFTVSVLSAAGVMAVRYGASTYYNIPSVGTYSIIMTGGSSSLFAFQHVAGGSAGAMSFTVDNVSVKEVYGNHASQSTAASRPVATAYGAYTGLLFDGADDGIAAPAGGGGTTGIFLCCSLKVVGGDGTSRSVWSDVGTNTGYRMRIASTNQLAIGAGNGTTFTSATTTDSVLAGNTYVLTIWDDGVNLNAQVNRGGIASVARPTVSAGGAGFSIAKDNNGATAFGNIAVFAMAYKKNGSDVSAADRLKAQRWCASKAGISI